MQIAGAFKPVSLDGASAEQVRDAEIFPSATAVGWTQRREMRRYQNVNLMSMLIEWMIIDERELSTTQEASTQKLV